MTIKPRSAIAPVVKTVKVECTPEEAFHYFTADFEKWWPLATHSCIGYGSEFKRKPSGCTFETRKGGRIIEHGSSDENHVWGTITEWQPPERVTFTWHPGREDVGQLVEIRFTPIASGTEVVLTHSGWENLGESAEKEREGYNHGWEAVFITAFREYAGRKGA
jgi:uncharacterized protein YndB with AHSA1/START domain